MKGFMQIIDRLWEIPDVILKFVISIPWDEFVDWRSVDNLALLNGRGRSTIVTSHGWTNHYHPNEDIETGIDGNTWQNIARNTFESAMDVNYIALNWEDGADPLGVDGYGQEAKLRNTWQR